MRRFRTLIVLLIMLMSIMILGIGSSEADGGLDNDVFDRQETVEAAGGALRISERVSHVEPPYQTAGGRTAISPSESTRLDAAVGAAFCAGADISSGSNGAPEIEALCGFLPLPGRALAIPGRGEVLSAFRELPLYRGAVRTDPELVSFVNLETFFWCAEAGRTCAAIGEGERTVTLLGQGVRIRPRIMAYDWRFGDGSGQRVTSGPAAHTYAHAGAMAVSVTLTWTADYAVGGGAFRPVGGTTTTTSPVRVLPVQEAEAVIMAGG